MAHAGPRLRGFGDRLLRVSWLVIGIYLFTLYVAGALVLRSVEPADSALQSISNYSWWFLVTITTVGYGDLTPVSVEGRSAAALIMVLGIGAIGMSLGRVGERFIDLGRTRMRGLAQLNERDHVVLIGYRPGESERMVDELRADSTFERRSVVLCSYSETENPLPDQVKFVHGDVTSEDTLARACVPGADLIIIHRDDDAKTIVSAIAAHSANPTAHIVVHLRSEENEKHLRRVSRSFECVTPLVIPLIVQAVQDPGISRLIRALTSNVAADDVLYRIDVPSHAPLRRFDVLLQLFKERYDAILLGVAESDARDAEIEINPGGGFEVRGGMALFYICDGRLTSVDWTAV